MLSIQRMRWLQPEQTSVWLTLLIVPFFILAPYAAGLFNSYSVNFEIAMFSYMIWLGLFLILVVGSLFVHIRFDQIQGKLALLIWFVPFSYLLSFFSAASYYSALIMLFLHILYAGLFVAGMYMNQSAAPRAWLQTAIVLSGYLVVGYGISNLLGWNYFQDALMDDTMGLRMTSVFQYANSYAAYLIVLIFACLFFITRSRSSYAIALHGFMLVPIAASFLMTLSRGGLLVLPIVLLFILPFLKLIQQLQWLFYMFASFIAAFLLSSTMNQSGIQVVSGGDPEPQTMWLLLLASVIMAALVVVVQRWLSPRLERLFDRLSRFRLSNFYVFFLAAGLGVAAVVLVQLFSSWGIFPQQLQQRIDNINFQQHSVLERLTFYRDAFKLVSDYPLFGAGGGAWRTLFEMYRNNPYVSYEAHNFFLQHLTEVGWFGWIGFMFLLGLILFLFIRQFVKQPEASRDYLLYYIVAAGILVHSMIDFNMSYVYLAALVYFSLGGMMAGVRSAPGRTRWQQLNRPVIRGIYCLVLMACIVVVIVHAVNHHKAAISYRDFGIVARQTQNFNEIDAPLERSMELNPYQPVVQTSRTQLYLNVYEQTDDADIREQLEHMLDRFEQREPYHRELFEVRYRLYVYDQDEEQTIEHLRQGLKLFPWEVTIYDRAISHMTRAAMQAYHDGDNESFARWVEETEHIVTVMEERVRHLNTLPEGQLPGKPFKVTPEIQENMELLRSFSTP